MIDPRNYIPGCASYTKASEISSLQKYLKKGIKKRDEALELSENPEELKKDPLVPEISELPKGAVGLHDSREVTELPDKSLKIVNPREETLVDHRETIKGAETPDLPESAVGLEDNREAALESRREDIEVPETDSLVDHRENITDEREITELPDNRLDINEALTPELPKEVLKAPGKIVKTGSLETTKLETPDSKTPNEVSELPKGVIEGPKFSEIPLETYREKIESNEDPGSLETHREDLEDKRNVALGDHKETIEDRQKVALEDHREDLEDKRGIDLENYREDLEDKQITKLSDHKDTIDDKRNVALENHKESLEDKRNPSLETRREDIEDKRSPKLETNRDNIEDKRNVTLDDTQLKTPGKQKTPELSGTVISGPEVKEVGLEKSKTNLTDKRSISLETKKEGLEDKRTPKLETRRDDLKGKDNPELPGTIIGLSDKRDIALGNRKETLEDSRNIGLSGTREDIKDPGTPDLPTDSVGLGIKSDISLDDFQEKLTGIQEVPGLPGDSKNIPGTIPNIVLPVDINKLEDTSEEEALEDERLDIVDDREVTLPTDQFGIINDKEVALPDGNVPIEGEVPEITSLEDTKIVRPGETPDLDKIYSDTTNGGLDLLNPVDVELVTIPQIQAEPEDNWTLEPDKNEIGWDGNLEDERLGIEDPGTPELVTVNDIKSEPEDNWTIEADKNDVGWDESLEDTVIPGEPDMSDPGWDGNLEDEQIKADSDQNPVGWDETLEDERLDIESPETPDLVTKEDIKAEPEDNWTMEPDMSDPGWDETLEDEQIKATSDQNPEGWDETLVTVDDIKAEPEDNWTVEPDKNPEGWNEALEDERLDIADINNILGLETEAVKITPHKVEASMDPDHAQKFVDTTHNHSFKKDIDGVSSSIKSEFSEETVIGLKEYGEETKDPKIMDPSQPNLATPNPWETGTDLNYIDTKKEGDLKQYGEKTSNPVKISPYEAGTPIDPDHAQKFVDTSQNHSFKSNESDGVSSSIESNFSSGTIIGPEEYGEETKDPLVFDEDTRPEYLGTSSKYEEYGKKTKKPIKMERPLDENIRTADPDHKHNFIDTSQNHSFSKDSDGVSSSIESEFSNTSDLKNYGKETEKPIEIMPSQGIPLSSKEEPDAEKDALEGPFHWSENNMGRSGWHIDDLAIPAYKLGGSFTSYLNPSKYLRFIVEKTVGAISFGKRGGSLKQWILDEALAGLITARDLLEETLNLQPYRLPGSNEYAIKLLRQGMSGVDLGDAKNFVGNTAANLLNSEAVIIKNPINRPGKEDKTKDGRKYRWEAMQTFESKDGQNGADLESRDEDVIREAEKTKKKAAEVITKALGSNQGLGDYVPKYLLHKYEDSNLGLKGTIENLTRTSIESVKDKGFTELKDAIENSPYITSSSKLIGQRMGDIHRHDIALTLDSNHVWEIILEPYLGVENGKKSFLPSIQQINYENFHNFGLCTNWDTWIPFTSFELNIKKMIQKNIGLYSGEISIPQNLEFTNELRLVICDDQYKSWKRYFDYVMYSSSYNCSVHDTEYFNEKKFIKYLGNLQDTFEADDLQLYYKNIIRPAPYKNLAFRCRIFSMNPQYQTINISDLLVVLKDFTEEWQGEVDASPTELALTFSVVGENPLGENGEDIKSEDESKLSEANYNIEKRSDLFQSYAEKMSDGISITL
jgi:hypothetical protein